MTYGTSGASMRGGPALGDSKANLETKGWRVYEGLIGLELVQRLGNDLMLAYGTCRAMQINKGLGENTDGSATISSVWAAVLSSCWTSSHFGH